MILCDIFVFFFGWSDLNIFNMNGLNTIPRGEYRLIKASENKGVPTRMYSYYNRKSTIQTEVDGFGK